jgi:hypothetical protein
MASTSFPRNKKPAAGLWVAVALFSVFGPLAAAPKSPASGWTPRRGDGILQQALRLADWFNWADAAPKFQEAEKLFTDERDRRNALYARIGVLRATMEDHSLTEVQQQLAEIAGTAEVQRDPELLLFASIAKADVDGELNAQDAKDDWQRIERLAKSQGNQKWANRSLQSFSEFLAGNISKGRVLIATALGRAQKTNETSPIPTNWQIQVSYFAPESLLRSRRAGWSFIRRGANPRHR